MAKYRFSGQTYDDGRDGERLSREYDRVFRLMRDGQWRTLEQIAEATGDPQASVSARLRDMRKKRFGEHTVERDRVAGADGLHVYRLLVNRGEPPAPIEPEQMVLF